MTPPFIWFLEHDFIQYQKKKYFSLNLIAIFLEYMYQANKKEIIVSLFPQWTFLKFPSKAMTVIEIIHCEILTFSECLPYLYT